MAIHVKFYNSDNNNQLLNKSALIILITGLILLIPLIAMQFSDEVNWGVFDFIAAGILISGTVIAYQFIAGRTKNKFYKTAIGIALATGLIIIWANLAVGIIGSEDNPANLLFFGVLLIGFVGAIISQFKAAGMAKTMFAVALAQALVPVIAFIIWLPPLDIGLLSTFLFNVFLVLLFSASAILFQKSAANKVAEK